MPDWAPHVRARLASLRLSADPRGRDRRRTLAASGGSPPGADSRRCLARGGGASGAHRFPERHTVGVVRSAHTRSVRDEVEACYFVAAAQQPSSLTSPVFLIGTATDTPLVLAGVRKAIQRLDASLPIMSARAVEEQMAPLTAQDRTTAQLVEVFGCVALTLATIGLYGVLSYGIARSTGRSRSVSRSEPRLSV